MVATPTDVLYARVNRVCHPDERSLLMRRIFCQSGTAFGNSAIPMKWDDRHQTLTLSAPIGKMQPKQKDRRFKIQVLTPSASGIVAMQERDVVYSNRTVRQRF